MVGYDVFSTLEESGTDFDTPFPGDSNYIYISIYYKSLKFTIMKKSMFFAALVAIMCAFSSCVNEPTIIGKWQLKTQKTQLIMNGQVVQTVEEPIPGEDPMYWQFVDESTGKMIQSFDGDVLTEEFTYTLTNNVLTITLRESSDFSITCQVVNLTETELSLTSASAPEGVSEYYQTTYNFTRVTE